MKTSPKTVAEKPQKRRNGPPSQKQKKKLINAMSEFRPSHFSIKSSGNLWTDQAVLKLAYKLYKRRFVRHERAKLSQKALGTAFEGAEPLHKPRPGKQPPRKEQPFIERRSKLHAVITAQRVWPMEDFILETRELIALKKVTLRKTTNTTLGVEQLIIDKS